MTAIVGILNKKAAVMAADSAQTVTRGDSVRIYNNTTKIFKLSDKFPVAVMIFNNLEFMNVPLDLLISRYRKNKGDEPFPTLQGYVDNFIHYMDTEEPLLKDEKTQNLYLCSEIGTYYEKVKNYAHDFVQEDIAAITDHEPSEDEVNEIRKARLREGIAAIAEQFKDEEKSPEFREYSFEQFLAYAKDGIDTLIDVCKDENMPTDMREDWEHGVYDYLCSNIFYSGTGLVFVGYGTDEIFPSLIPIYVSGIFDNHFRFCYSKEENEQISNDNESAIVPFAQVDVMMTVMRGISPAIGNKVDEAAAEAVEQTKEKMLDAMKDAGLDEETIARVMETETADIKERHSEGIQSFIQKEYVDGLINTVEAFGIEDMANMAESLIEITNLQRHITSSEESVGGPVDVAVLTLDRGFVWLKHHDWASSGQDVDFRKK